MILLNSPNIEERFYFWRNFKNRREVGSAAGLCGIPYDSGGKEVEQGISKAGNGRIRRITMTSSHDLFSNLVTSFFTRHLAAELDASEHTIASYRDAFCLLLQYVVQSTGRPVTALTIDDLDPDRILDFLVYIEQTPTHGMELLWRDRCLGYADSTYGQLLVYMILHNTDACCQTSCTKCNCKY